MGGTEQGTEPPTMGKKNKTADQTNSTVDPWADDTNADTAPNPKKPKKDKADVGGYGDLGGPGSGGNFVPKEHADDLLLITPLSLEEDITTSYGTKSAIKADIVILNRKTPANSEEIAGGLIFPAVLQGQLQNALARRSRVVGTLIEDLSSKKPGQNAPWKLTAPTDADIQVAKAYLDSLDPLR